MRHAVNRAGDVPGRATQVEEWNQVENALRPQHRVGSQRPAGDGNMRKWPYGGTLTRWNREHDEALILAATAHGAMVGESTRPLRRHNAQIAKDRARFMAHSIWRTHPKDDRSIGRLASVHCVPCSCPGCGNYRRNPWMIGAKGLTMQERREFQRDKYEEER